MHHVRGCNLKTKSQQSNWEHMTVAMSFKGIKGIFDLEKIVFSIVKTFFEIKYLIYGRRI